MRQEPKHLAGSCWQLLLADGSGLPDISNILEPHRDCVSYHEWAQGVHTIHHIVNSIWDPYSVDELIGEGNPLHYQLFYEPPKGRVCLTHSQVGVPKP